MADSAVETLLVGIDGASHDLVSTLASTGVAPRLGSLLTDGASGSLESQVPPSTASAWPSVSTGVNPGQHGVFGHVQFSGYDWDIVSGSDVQELTLWELLSYNGLRSVVVNVPVTHSPREFDGGLVPGYTAPEFTEWSHPEARDSFERKHGPYRIYPDQHTEPEQEYESLVTSRGNAFCHLADRLDPEFGFVVFRMPERAIQSHPGDESLLESVYAAVDEQLGRLVDRYSPNTVIVVSDHGMEFIDREIRVNELLRREGYLETTSSVRGTRLPDPIDHTPFFGSRGSGDATHPGGASRVWSLLSGIGILHRGENRTPPDDARVGIDVASSTAFMRSSVEPGIRLNRRDRDPAGPVHPDDYERTRDRLIDLLSELTLPNGEPAFDDVARREKYFWGPNTDSTADVVLIPQGQEWTLSGTLGGEVVGTPGERWSPTSEAFIAMTGETTDPDADLTGSHLFDVAPTVLASLGAPVSDRMHGDVLPAIPATERRAYPRLGSGRRPIGPGADPT